jgi:2-succinyl-6-hydroxy-2,4-cyclohexadiene-1-carboxylate synthase
MSNGLAYEIEGAGVRLGLVHGFTQTARCWGPFAPALGERFEIVRVDAPGHGRSSEVHADLTAGAALVGDAVGRAVYVGYSMGGRHTLRLALDRPDLVERLVLIGASPGLADPEARAARRAADEVLAARIEHIGVAAFIDEWLAQPLFAGLPAAARFVDERATNTSSGLASSLRLAGTGAQEPLWDRLSDLDAPTLLLVGADDEKFGDIAAQMAERIGTNASVLAVPGTGHAPHLEAPRLAADVVLRWLSP